MRNEHRRYLDRQYGIYDYLLRQKAEGRIRHLGFSVHGSYDVMQRFLDAYGESMEFGQVQLNYIDWTFQNAEAKVKRLSELGIPVWVMEPLRGGKLAALPDESAAALRKLRPEETVPGWAFRFLQTIPGVTVTLSGMSNFQQLCENIRTFETDEPLSAAELQALSELAEAMTSQSALPCTACRYCTGHCPQQLDIPDLLALYNEHRFTGRRLPRADGAFRAAGRQAAERLHRLSKLRGRLSAADQDFRSARRFCRHAQGLIPRPKRPLTSGGAFFRAGGQKFP